jgi:hypothetical protein
MDDNEPTEQERHVVKAMGWVVKWWKAWLPIVGAILAFEWVEAQTRLVPLAWCAFVLVVVIGYSVEFEKSRTFVLAELSGQSGFTRQGALRKAVAAAGIHGDKDEHRPLLMSGFESHPLGWTCLVKLPSGLHEDAFKSKAATIAHSLGARSVEFEFASPGLMLCTIANKADPLLSLLGPWPWACFGGTEVPKGHSWAEPIPVGMSEMGQVTTIDLADKSLLIGGLPGSGKSVATQQMLMAAALCPEVHISCAVLVATVCPWWWTTTIPAWWSNKKLGGGLGPPSILIPPVTLPVGDGELHAPSPNPPRRASTASGVRVRPRTGTRLRGLGDTV